MAHESGQNSADKFAINVELPPDAARDYALRTLFVDPLLATQSKHHREEIVTSIVEESQANLDDFLYLFTYIDQLLTKLQPKQVYILTKYADIAIRKYIEAFLGCNILTSGPEIVYKDLNDDHILYTRGAAFSHGIAEWLTLVATRPSHRVPTFAAKRIIRVSPNRLKSSIDKMMTRHPDVSSYEGAWKMELGLVHPFVERMSIRDVLIAYRGDRSDEVFGSSLDTLAGEGAFMRLLYWSDRRDWDAAYRLANQLR